MRSDNAGFGGIACIEAPELGLYLEDIMPGPELLARFEATPAWWQAGVVTSS